MDAEQLEGGVTTPETLPLPSSPRKRQASQDPDHLLDAMLVDKLDDDAPTWAMTLHTSINSKLEKLISSNDDLTVRVDHLETKAVGDQSRISALEDQVQELKRALGAGPEVLALPLLLRADSQTSRMRGPKVYRCLRQHLCWVRQIFPIS